MPDFSDAQLVEQICYEFKLADFNRGKNRSLINQLFNGWPPYSGAEVEENNIAINVNDLTGTRLAHDARSQLYGAFLKPGKFFSIRPDGGPKHKRQSWAMDGTDKINSIMKRSIDYFECYRSKLALDVLHGVGPAAWENSYGWCPDPVGIEDILIPAKTVLTMKNLPFFAIYRSFTAPELIKLTRRAERDPGWNMDLVEACLEWIDNETSALMGSTWPEVWSPEKMQERVKGDGGFYPADSVPTVDCFDFYYYSEDDQRSGWRRRIILDSWGTPSQVGGNLTMNRRPLKKELSSKRDIFKIQKSDFLYTSGDNYFSDSWRNVMSFQFADLSSVAPFQYHSVRSLGFLVYALCHLQNRMRCKFNEAVFEALMPYFKIKNMEDAQRALKLNMITRGLIDDTITPVPAAERYQVNTGLVELGINQNAALIEQHASSYSPNNNFTKDRTEKTRYQVMAEVNAMTNLISGAFNQAYQYQEFEDREILRRFFIKDTRDPECQQFQNCLLRAGVPEKYMCADAWESSHERVVGAGNQTLEMSIAEWLMGNRMAFEPDAQREILRKSTFTVTGDSDLASRLVPDAPSISSSIHDAQMAAGALMQGLPMALAQGVNHSEYAEALMATMVNELQKIEQGPQRMGTPEQVAGLQNIAGQDVNGQLIPGNGAANHIALLAQDPHDKATPKRLRDQLSKLMNLVKASHQRLVESQQAAAQQAQQSQGGGLDGKDAAKIAGMQAQAQAKVENMRTSHAQRTAQRRIQFEQQLKQQQEEHAAKLARDREEAAQEIARKRFALED